MLNQFAIVPTAETDSLSLRDVSSHDDLVDRVDLYRVAASSRLDPEVRSEMGQFLTPPSVARFMASLFSDAGENIRLLDAGAGVGTLTAAFVERSCSRSVKPKNIEATVFEIDRVLASYLGSALNECRDYCRARGVEFTTSLRQADFIAAGAEQLRADLFAPQLERYNRAILNPPYRKIRSDSPHRILLREVGIETSNLYAGFLAIVVRLLEPAGELVAITPRSFCNGPYFTPFRKILLESMVLKRVHVFDLRDKAFQDDDVLQENIIFHAIKDGQRDKVAISRSCALDDDTMSFREVAYAQVMRPDDPSLVIHLAANDMDAFVKDRLAVFEHTLDKLGLAVSTGRVVDFRIKELLRAEPERGTAPLIYPGHFVGNTVRWPNPNGRKPEALVVSDVTRPLLLPAGNYVLVKRFSAKEEPRRVVAAVFNEATVRAPAIGFENHLNVYHIRNMGLPLKLARGLAAYLNSTLVDIYFRQFSGQTQVNASDLRMLTYPARDLLERLGAQIGDQPRSQREIDSLLEEEMRHMTDIQSPDPVAARQRVTESLEILRALGLPRGQLNERSALTLLALLGLRPDTPWQDAANPRMGITPIMDFCRDHYGTRYAPNTRETFRRQTMHQFVEACLAVANPDQPDRPTNSPKWCYQVEPRAFRLLRAFGTPKWDPTLAEWRLSVESLKHRYARERAMNKIPLRLSESQELYLTPGNHSRLVRAVVEEFAPRFAPGGQAIYIGDTGEKWAYFDSDKLRALGVEVDEHGKMPDVVIYFEAKDWLLLIEAVTSHGPVDAKRHSELTRLFKGARPGLVFVTAFLTRSDMAKYVGEISWETEVWFADSETHLLHFNGGRFLGPYDAQGG